MNSEHYDIAIVGGGMVGSALACALAGNAETASCKIAIVEAGTGEPPILHDGFDARVVALSNKSVKFFQSIGVWEDILALRVSPYTDMYVWDGEGTANVQFSCYENRESQLGFIVENNVIVRALRNKIKLMANVRSFHSTVVKDIDLCSSETKTEQIISVERQKKIEQIRASIVVAADGAHSSVRKLLDIPTREWDYEHSAIVATVETERAHQQTAWQRFTSTGPIAFLPLIDKTKADERNASETQKYCSLVWSAESELATKLMQMSDAEFCRQLSRAFEQRLGNIIHVDKRFCIPLRQRHAESYVLPGLALVGDAAHTIHPLAGQGVNLGLYDVEALVAELARGRKRGIDLTHFSLLQRYERERQSHNLLAMATMEGFKQLFSTELPGLRWLRNTGMRFFNQQAWLKKKLITLASG